jgi:hypothetical protein
MTRLHAITLALVGTALAPATMPAQSQCEAPATTQPFLPELADSGRIFRGNLSRDGREFWFFRKVATDPRQEDYRIYVATRDASGWSTSRQVDLGGEYSDLYPALRADGRRLVFASYRRAPGDTASKPNASLWYADRRGDGWGPARFIAPATELGHYHSQVSLAADGDVYFRRTTPDWSRTVELVAPARGTGYDAAQLVEGADRFRDWNPGYHVWGARPGHDRSYLILEVSAVDSAGRRGPSDLWFATRHGGTWSDPRPFGAGVNSPEYDNFASVSQDGCRLLFTRGFSGFYHVSLAAAMAGSPDQPSHRPD